MTLITRRIFFSRIFFGHERYFCCYTCLTSDFFSFHFFFSANNDIDDKKKVLLLDYFNVSYPDYATYKGWELKACQVCADGSEPVTQVSFFFFDFGGFTGLVDF